MQCESRETFFYRQKCGSSYTVQITINKTFINSWIISKNYSYFSDQTFSFFFCFQVSWVRHRDIHLLTVGRYTYTSDQRFRALHQPHTEDWILQIKYPQHRDSGIYECQISTTPHLSHFIHLNVVGKFYRKIMLKYFKKVEYYHSFSIPDESCYRDRNRD